MQHRQYSAQAQLISIHALHEESDAGVNVIKQISGGISIHALHEESDSPTGVLVVGLDISIHALHEESDPISSQTTQQSASFQSTLSMRRATCCRTGWRSAQPISIHALHEESDPS